MPFGKGKGPKPPKPPKEKKPKKPKKGQAPKDSEAPEGQEPDKKKKLNPIFLILPLVVIAAAAVIIIFVVLPRFRGGDDSPEPTPTVEPQPPELPEELKVGEESVVGMALEADESEAEAVLAKTVTYTYINLNNAGKAAETYVNQLAASEGRFSVVDEEFVRTDRPDFTAPEGMVLMARNLPVPVPEAPAESEAPEESGDPEASPGPEESSDPEANPEPTATPVPAEEPVRMVLTVRITWSEGQCVVTADEEEGMVTSPPRQNVPSSEAVTMRGAQDRLRAMSPAELGLPGESMSEYEVISVDGVEMVDSAACIRVNVYSEVTATQGSEFMGSYLMSVDGQHLYRLNPITDEIEELK